MGEWVNGEKPMQSGISITLLPLFPLVRPVFQPAFQYKGFIDGQTSTKPNQKGATPC